MRMVITKEECEEAAAFVNLTDTSVYEMQVWDRPKGCIYSNPKVSGHFLIWASPENHPREHGTARCGAIQNKLSYNCICAQNSSKCIISENEQFQILDITCPMNFTC